MLRFFIPIIFIAASVALFEVYIQPTYQNIKKLQVQEGSYDDALTKAQELRTRRDDLLKTRDSFSTGDIAKLQHLLPENVDNIRLIIDIGNIAAHRNLTLSGVDLGDLSKSKQSTVAGADGTLPKVGSLVVGFSVTTTYDNFLAFVSDLEHSLRLLDIEHLSFSTGPGGATTYTVSLHTYWLH